jgi:NADPH:quinone reductase-like Zn-dependent oxidoreductase
MGAHDELAEAARHFFDGQFYPVIDKVFPLADAAAAHRRLEAREQFGKIVLTT